MSSLKETIREKQEGWPKDKTGLEAEETRPDH
jgi:hypothetical protein